MLCLDRESSLIITPANDGLSGERVMADLGDCFSSGATFMTCIFWKSSSDWPATTKDLTEVGSTLSKAFAW